MRLFFVHNLRQYLPLSSRIPLPSLRRRSVRRVTASEYPTKVAISSIDWFVVCRRCRSLGFESFSRRRRSSSVFQRNDLADLTAMGSALAMAARLASKSIVTYLCLGLLLECPSQCAMVLRLTPDLSR